MFQLIPDKNKDRVTMYVTGSAGSGKSYFVATPKDSTLNEDFVHSQLICLIDPHLHIRGYYDGTNGKDVKKLIEDIQKLKVEYNKDGRQKTIDLFPYFRGEK